MRTIYVDKDIPRALVVKALRPVWRNVAFSAISPSKFAEIPEPALPGSRWVRVRNRLCGICASDVSLLFVEADPDVSPVALPGYQRIYLGHETVGEVVEIGSAVTRVKLGDRVVFAGSSAQGLEPWVTDGSRAGTSMLADLNTDTLGSLPTWDSSLEDADAATGFVALGSRRYFVADDGVHGRELWRTDDSGTESPRVTRTPS